jgi:hypothetical protein
LPLVAQYGGFFLESEEFIEIAVDSGLSKLVGASLSKALEKSNQYLHFSLLDEANSKA